MIVGRWTILIMSDDGAGVRQYRLSRGAARGLIAAGLLGLSIFISLASQAVGRIHGPTRTARLERENGRLKSELEELQGRVVGINASFESLSKNDQHFRLVAGLEPLPDEVRQAGIGGPEHSPDWPFHPETGRALQQVNLEVSSLRRRANVLNLSWREAHDSLKFQYERLSRTPSIQPTAGHISSAFSRWRQHPILNLARPHAGIDITAQRGTPIVASARGKVRFVGRNGEFGLMVEIDHGFNVVTRYAHASKILVRAGQTVERGDTIALVGSTGLAAGDHLHYEVLVGGRAVNPRQYLITADAIPD